MIMEQLHSILSEREPPLLKVNALFALQMLLDTCQHPIVEMT